MDVHNRSNATRLLRWDLKARCEEVGYAFINFLRPDDADACLNIFERLYLERCAPAFGPLHLISWCVLGFKRLSKGPRSLGVVPPEVLGPPFPTLPEPQDQQRLHCSCSGEAFNSCSKRIFNRIGFRKSRACTRTYGTSRIALLRTPGGGEETLQTCLYRHIIYIITYK